IAMEQCARGKSRMASHWEIRLVRPMSSHFRKATACARLHKSLVASLWLVWCVSAFLATRDSASAKDALDSSTTSFVSQYCASCHDKETKKGELDLDIITSEAVAAHPETWEKVARKLR